MAIYGYFRRIADTSFRMRPDIHGPIVLVNPGDVIKADISIYKDIVGFEFVGVAEPDFIQTKNDDTVESIADKLGDVEIVRIQNKTPQYVEILNEDAIKPEKIVPQKDQTKEEVLNEVRNITTKQWFTVTKDKIMYYYEKLELDASLLPNNRLELIKNLKKTIKEM